MSKRTKRRARDRHRPYSGYEVAAALYVATGGLIDLWTRCTSCEANGASDMCVLCRGTGRIAS